MQVKSLENASSVAITLGVAAVLVTGGIGTTLTRELDTSDNSLRAQYHELILETEEPEVIFVGNSRAGKALDPEALSTALGRRVSKLSIGDSKIYHWIDVLENHVYGAGHTPSLVLVPTSLTELLITEAAAEEPEDESWLTEVMGAVPMATEDGVDPSLKLDRARTQTRRLFTNAVPALILGTAMGSTSRGKGRLVQATSTVFDPTRIDYTLMEKRRVARALEVAIPTTEVSESLVHDLVKVVHDHGGQVVFLRTPVASGDPYADPIPLSKERELIQLFDELDVGYASMWDLPFTDADFQDPLHLGDSGKAMATRFTARTLKSWKRGDKLVFPKVELPFPEPTATMSGEPPPPIVLEVEQTKEETCSYVTATVPELAPFEEGVLEALLMDFGLPFSILQDGEPLVKTPRKCWEGSYWLNGAELAMVPHRKRGASEFVLEARPKATRGAVGLPIHWLFPGMSISFAWDEPWPRSRGPLQVVVAAQPLGEGAGVPMVRSGDASAPLEGYGGQLRATLDPTRVDGPWSIEISNPPDGSYLAIVDVSVGTGERRVQAVRTRPNALEGSLVVVGGPRSELVEWTGDVPQLPAPIRTREFHPKRHMGVFHVPELLPLSDTNTGRCSPVTVFEDGVALEAKVVCSDVAGVQGAVCHRDEAITFSPSDNTRADTNGRTYELGLTQTTLVERFCGNEIWLFPGQEVRVPINYRAFPVLHSPAKAIDLTGLVVSRTRALGSYTVSLEVDGVQRVRRTVTGKDLMKGTRVFLDRPVSPDSKEGTLSIENVRGSAFLLLRSARLSE